MKLHVEFLKLEIKITKCAEIMALKIAYFSILKTKLKILLAKLLGLLMHTSFGEMSKIKEN